MKCCFHFPCYYYLVREAVGEMLFKWTFSNWITIFYPSRAGYRIYRSQCKIKMCSPLLKIKNFNFGMVTSEHLIKCGALLSARPCVTWGTCLIHRRLLVSESHVRVFLSLESVPCRMVHISDDGLPCETQEGEEECHYNCIQGYFNPCWLLLLL